MATTYRIALSVATLLLFTCAAHAQQPFQKSASAGVAAASVGGGSGAGQTMTIHVPAPPHYSGVITGAPYCAEVVSESLQTLADGTHIEHKSRSTKTCRDSEGRTRRESSPGGAEVIEIHDPVSGFRYLLDVQNRVAHRFAPATEKANGVATYTQTARADSSPRNEAPARTATPAQAPPERPQMSSESLGTQVIEGVLAEGTKTTTTFPVGLMGNDRPIVRVMESWHSPELKITLLSKNSDPRTGEHIMRLQNVDRSEPNPALFRVPPDYQIVDENSDQVEIKLTRP